MSELDRIVAYESIENWGNYEKKVNIILTNKGKRKELGIIYSDSGGFYPPNLLEIIEAKKKRKAEITDVFSAILIGLARTPIHSLPPKPFKRT